MLDVAERVKTVIAEQLKVKSEMVTKEAKIVDDLGAESLDIVEMFVMLEEDFDIKIPDEEVEQMATVGDAIKCIEDKLASK
ncbi:MAG: acyl carrier protein [Candidatus Omnitrophota bacterium]